MTAGGSIAGEIAPGPITLFYSYSHKDESLREELAKHLTTLKRAGFIREWHDRQILGGEEWDRQISIHLETAQVILLLISADFLASKYCYDIEATRALERHFTGTARVIPIILRPVFWRATPFAALQALPTDARAVTEWPNRDLAFVNICEGILALVVAWKDSPGGGLSARQATISRRPASRNIPRVRKRVMDAALPRRVQTGAATALVVMLRREDSSGLRTIVEVETSYGVQKEDVRSTGSFPIEFPVDSSGRLAPLELELEIHAPEFAPPVQGKSISVPPRGDSEPKVFLLTPQRQGELVLTVQLRQADTEMASCLLRTNAAVSEQEITPGGHSLVSIPLAAGEEADRAATSLFEGAQPEPKIAETKERERIEKYLKLDLPSLCSLIPLFSEDMLFAPSGQISRGEQLLEELKPALRRLLCRKWRLCEKIPGDMDMDEVELIATIAEVIAPLVYKIPPALIATILLKLGIRKFCGCEGKDSSFLE